MLLQAQHIHTSKQSGNGKSIYILNTETGWKKKIDILMWFLTVYDLTRWL